MSQKKTRALPVRSLLLVLISVVGVHMRPTQIKNLNPPNKKRVAAKFGFYQTAGSRLLLKGPTFKFGVVSSHKNRSSSFHTVQYGPP
jgi:hypothetical protein